MSRRWVEKKRETFATLVQRKRFSLSQKNALVQMVNPISDFFLRSNNSKGVKRCNGPSGDQHGYRIWFLRITRQLGKMELLFVGVIAPRTPIIQDRSWSVDFFPVLVFFGMRLTWFHFLGGNIGNGNVSKIWTGLGRSGERIDFQPSSQRHRHPWCCSFHAEAAVLSLFQWVGIFLACDERHVLQCLFRLFSWRRVFGLSTNNATNLVSSQLLGVPEVVKTLNFFSFLSVG